MPDDPEPSLSDSVPGLLPWQVCFLFFILGIPALRFPVPCLGAGCVLWLADRTLRGPGLKPWFVAFCFLAGIGYGWARAPQIPEDMPDWMREREKVLVHGVVDEVVPNTGARLRVILRDVTCEMRGGEGEALPGRLVWNWRFPAYDPCPGQRVQVWLRVLPVHGLGNPGQWDYEWYWARQNVFWRSWATGKNVNAQWGERPDDAFWKLKAGLRRAVEDHVPKTPGGGVVLALVSGDRHLVGANAMDLARSAGLSHVLALSGLHVGFVAMIGLGLAHVLCLVRPGLMLRIPRPRLAVLLAAPLVLAYAWLGQPSPSLLRAACMYAAWGVLLFMGRPRVLLDGLFFALACIVIRSPLSVFDLGLQMSAVAVAGIVLLYPLVSPLFRFSGGMIRVGISRALGILGVSMCANLALLPLLSWYFGQLAPNVLFNLVWLPVIGFWVMPLGLLGMVLAPFSATQAMSAWLFKGAGVAVDLLLTLVGRAGEAGATPLVAVLRPWWPEMLGGAVLLCVVIACRGAGCTAVPRTGRDGGGPARRAPCSGNGRGCPRCRVSGSARRGAGAGVYCFPARRASLARGWGRAGQPVFRCGTGCCRSAACLGQAASSGRRYSVAWRCRS
ncbi:ComEC/Rec2 family competence protein [Pseudodesulfovibrio tunisiensis]|uniref:ComEC/Rec2 family competence protein n=1 Tax=Pseudodesulfovibrio tunisiensis TaxID=463192 RepID=UPI001FB2779F|nr:ComEC/Rec2 family competence protein [Pseudodesulfovibrio tunisiensis]